MCRSSASRCAKTRSRRVCRASWLFARLPRSKTAASRCPPLSTKGDMTDDILDRAIPDIARLVASGDVRAETIAERAIERIQARDMALGAFLTIDAELALERA